LNDKSRQGDGCFLFEIKRDYVEKLQVILQLQGNTMSITWNNKGLLSKINESEVSHWCPCMTMPLCTCPDLHKRLLMHASSVSNKSPAKQSWLAQGNYFQVQRYYGTMVRLGLLKKHVFGPNRRLLFQWHRLLEKNGPTALRQIKIYIKKCWNYLSNCVLTTKSTN
jgi:hypothetical protein